MKKRYEYGIVQGRLVPQLGSFIQNFPVDHWLTEIKIAEKVGCSAIEWIATPEFGFVNEKNPIINLDFVDKVHISDNYHVNIDTLCLDEIPTLGLLTVLRKTYKHLKKLNSFGIQRIVLPLLEGASMTLPSTHTRERLDEIQNFTYSANQQNIAVSLESDLGFEELSKFVEKIHAPVRITLDTGNLLRLGYDPVEYTQKFGEKIDNIHVKDACLGGASVPLGHGRGQLSRPKLHAILQHVKCNRLTFQTARMSENTDIETFKHNVAYVESAFEVGDGPNLHGIIW